MRFRIFVILSSLVTANLSAEGHSELARVGIVRFINTTKNPDLEWVRQSLPDAIDQSMKDRFEYVRLSETKVQAAAESIRYSAAGYSPEEAAKVAIAAQADILIYGSFRTDEPGKELILYSVILNAADKRVIGKIEHRSQLNTSLFKNIDLLAAEIVSEIYRYTLKPQNAKAAQNIRLLVMARAPVKKLDQKKAEAQLKTLKTELQRRNPGNYLTVSDLFDKYHIPRSQRKVILNFAKKREQNKLQVWLENYGIENTMIVWVNDNKLTINSSGTIRESPVSFPVAVLDPVPQKGATDEVPTSPGPLQVRNVSPSRITNLTFLSGITLLKGGLISGQKLGVLSGLSIHASFKLGRWFEPHINMDLLYGIPNATASYAVGASSFLGAGYTLGGDRFNFSACFGAGVFASQITTKRGSFNVVLPELGFTFSARYFFSSTWGMAINFQTQYIIDPITPALLTGGSVSGIIRF